MLIHAYFFITTCLGLGIKSVTWNSNRTQTKKPDPLQVWNVKKYSNVQIIMQYKYLKQNICTSNIQFNIYFDMFFIFLRQKKGDGMMTKKKLTEKCGREKLG